MNKINMMMSIPQWIHTSNGNKLIDDIVIGDEVYSYTTGEPIPILGIHQMDPDQIYKVKFSDGREEYYRESEQVVTDHGNLYISEIQDILNNNKHNIAWFKPNAVVRYTSDRNDKLIPDPYVVGAFLTYGDYNKLEINIPNECIDVCEYLYCKYKIDMHSLCNNTYLFKYEYSDAAITWDEFIHLKYGNIKMESNCNMVPDEYIRSTVFERFEFIRGVFDAGCKYDNWYTRPIILNKYLYRLFNIRDIIYSLGMLATISKVHNELNYQLSLNCLPVVLPELFYNITKKYHAIEASRLYADDIPTPKTFINKIEPFNISPSHALILETPNSVYLTSQFIPKLSV